jgi:hypothetical protein
MEIFAFRQRPHFGIKTSETLFFLRAGFGCIALLESKIGDFA